jgi:ADP-ribose pyrophosphatase YjhB (NUDIX family)
VRDVAGFYFRDPHAPPPNRPRRVGVAAIIEHDGSLLLDRRIDPPGWGLVAGSVEEAESVSHALTREVAEETGLRLIDHILFGVFSDPTRIVRYADGNTYRTITIAFVVRVEEIDALRPSAESAEVRLVPKGALGGLDLIATHRPIIDLYVSGGEPPYVD